MDNIETLYNRKMVVAETVCFWFVADLFNSAPMILESGYHGQHWDVSLPENGCCRNRWFQKRRRPFQISTDDPRLCFSFTTSRRFAKRRWLLQKPLVSDSKQTSSKQYQWSQAVARMQNMETFHNQKMVVAEIVGLRLEADLFKSVPTILGMVVIHNMDNIETLHCKTSAAAEKVVSDLKQTFSNQYRLSQSLVVIVNIETWHHQRAIAAETVGLMVKADLFKSVQISPDFGCHGQRWDVSQ